MQTTKIGQLSDGQKSRIVFGMLCMANHNMLLLDEPTNHLDSECPAGAAAALHVS
jgi:ATP-binding cassette subfamily F protein 2